MAINHYLPDRARHECGGNDSAIQQAVNTDQIGHHEEGILGYITNLLQPGQL